MSSNEYRVLHAMILALKNSRGGIGGSTGGGGSNIGNAQLAAMPDSTIKGRAVGAGTGDPQDLTGTQATEILDELIGDSGSGGTKGLAPAPAAGDAAAGYFLKADGTWSLPPGSGATGVFTTTATGTQDDLTFAGASVLRCNNASDLTITGLVAGQDGQILTIVAVGSGNVYLPNEDNGSSAANRLSNIVTSGPTPLSGGTGRATYVYVGSTDRWVLVAHEQGDWTVYTYDAADFTCNGATTWTVDDPGDVLGIAYKIVGRQMFLAFAVGNTSVSNGSSAELRFTLPGGYTLAPAPAFTYSSMFLRNAGTAENGYARVDTGTYTDKIAFVRGAAANWSSATNTTSVVGQMTLALE